MILETDRKRNFFLLQFSGKEVSQIHFDFVINMATFSHKEAIGVILNALDMKGIV